MCNVLCHHRGRIKEDIAGEMTFDGLLRVEEKFAMQRKERKDVSGRGSSMPARRLRCRTGECLGNGMVQ